MANQTIKRFVIKDEHGNILKQDAFSVVGDIHVSVDGGVGEPSAESEYADGELTITLHNLKGEGISNISFTPSEEDGGENLLTITTDGGHTYSFVILNGSKGEQGVRGNGIASIEAVESIEDGGINTITVTDDDGNTKTFSIRNGRTGAQGTSAIWNGEAEVLTELEHTLGDKTNRTMSQHGITEQLVLVDNKLVLDAQGIFNLPNMWYINTSTGKWASTTSNYAGEQIKDATPYHGLKMLVVPNGEKNARFAFIKTRPSSTGEAVVYCEGTELYNIDETQTYTVPDDCVLIYINRTYNGSDRRPQQIKIYDEKTVKDKVEELSGEIKAKPTLQYVSAADGDDVSDGLTKETAKQTFAAALDAGADNMTIVLIGDTNETFSLYGRTDKTFVRLKGDRSSRARIIKGTIISEAVPYLEYEDVYSYTPEDANVLPQGTKQWLWQHDLADERTAISAEERHPLQRGRVTRQLSTRLTYASSLQVLLDASVPCWYLDSETNTLYFRAAVGSDIDANPIVIPKYNEAGIYATSSVTLDVSCVEVWYGYIKTDLTSQSRLSDCAARYMCNAAAIQWDNARALTLVRCEADGCTMYPSSSTAGDGFNAHTNTNVGEALNKNTTCTMIDCWSHDNRDDGYSCHERCETTIIGGLFEYNGKGGIATATGCHDTVNGVVSRKNSRGILCGVNAADGGVGTQLVATSCLCCDNSNNYECADGLDGNENSMTLVNCVSVRAASTGYNAKTQYAKIVAYNCTDEGSATAKTQYVTAVNGTLI